MLSMLTKCKPNLCLSPCDLNHPKMQWVIIWAMLHPLPKVHENQASSFSVILLTNRHTESSLKCETFSWLTFLMKATEKVSQETMPWSISSTKAVRVKDSRSPKLKKQHTQTHNRPQETSLQQMAWSSEKLHSPDGSKHNEE